MRHSLIAVTILLTACTQVPANNTGSSGTLKIDQGVTEIQTINTAMPAGTPAVPGHGKEEGLAYGALNGVGETRANGIATVHYLEDGYGILGAQVNIAAAPDNHFYEGWLETMDGGKRISVGHLTNPFNDARHAVRFESETSLKEYERFVVTLEPDDGNTNSSSPVANAILKHTTR